MKKNFKFYAIIWAIGLVVFNLVAFLIPKNDGLSSGFWLGYAFITLAFILQLGTAYFAFQEKNLNRLFLNISTISISFTTLICTIIISAVTMAVPGVPEWLGAILCFVVFVIGAVAVLTAKQAADIASEVEDKVKTKTQFIRLLSTDAEHLMSTAKTPELKAEAKKVYEAIHYSDPMSNDALSDIEAKIQYQFNAFTTAIKNEDIDLSTASAAEFLDLIDNRNKKCKVLK